MTIIVCLNHNNYLGRGDEYDDKLLSGVSRNTQAKVIPTLPTGLDPDNRMFPQFVCLTEHDLPEGIEGWWNKLALFQPDLFPKGERILYIDLDTIVVGALDDLLSYDGPFAAISDFYRPDDLASGVMSWEAGHAAPTMLWEMWDQAGRPQFHPLGDGGWVGQLLPKADRLDKLYPGQIVSLKIHCADGIPDGARLICFHGLPRPHTLADIMQNW